MIRPLRSLLLALSLVATVATAAPAPMDGDQLKQVVLLSRHNLRAPVVASGALANATPEAWPRWEVAPGELTTKGGVLEVYMGRYIAQWLRQAQLLPVSGCPQEDDFHAYANSLQRTQATAQFFVAGAFPGCHVAVEQRMPLGTMDPLFNPVIHRDDAAFRARAASAMQQALSASDLAPALSVVEEITRYPQSAACKGHNDCHLALSDTTFSAEPGKEPRVSGSLALASGLVDALLMEHYQGSGIPREGWGRLTTEAQWQALAQIRNRYQDILFGTPEVARDVAGPLLARVDALLEDPASPKVSLLVGHDSNIGSVLAALGISDYSLPGQYEKTPIGGLLQFERWRDRHSGVERIRLAYVYPTTAQLRDALSLTNAQPPGRVALRVPGCAAQGCTVAEFQRLLHPASR
ncbi:TPA: bifunctional glucose-1-phosphatase/inositol phosphatase [Stenotrophomonas maltophilia]|uniref:bifunctional glucose-1-phosphatase/inositol phosphatase n=1 Tax=Stenotrophomonas maltophilia TaxID=40324 RepID=UPI0013118BF3|nr:bifunctional glucose-1-phosphatase/inositol phosphatase [Stenotrophomonas maltophilia]MBA0285460.1 bifunctional glucose-1-phosphatase/inositol phosphatase [Stenotrophomonas maltophilia]MBA0325040.1 bifunctional glucose-1-phosphatase/inositol phosphatase [Stenotrophomonas maltophilia]HDS1129492.1 bifunctional glucose-1-phosphatase/inositol phosphatase [Stenotrophomonas maltophilia]HDS1154916.1 bifunctional glucose-1-phosphatase/inositol phosphatase [Stenotrophomonas maltophilia]HDS1164541.1 